MIAKIVQDVIDDLSSRQALAGAASVLYIGAFIGGWALWVRRIRRNREMVDVAVLVTGSRGKSSTVRALHAAFSAAGLFTYAKTTGTAAAELSTDGSETATRRIGQVSILEVLRIMAKASRAEPRPRALVFECMAVKPNLIGQIAHEMLLPDVVIITNAQVDHLEDEGSSLEEIARSMSEAIRPGSLVVTGESRDETLRAIRTVAEERGARFVAVSPGDASPEIFARLPYVHPQNVTFVLGITRSLGIDDDVAVDGMARCSKEPGEREIWRHSIGNLDALYTDLGAINDPSSLMSAIESFPWPVERDVPRIGLVTGRWDRPLRDLSFVGCLDRDRFDGLILTGGPVYRMRRELVANGWPPERIVVAAHLNRWRRVRDRRVVGLTSRIAPEAKRIMFVGLENEHDPLADRVRSYFGAGEAVHSISMGGER